MRPFGIAALVAALLNNLGSFVEVEREARRLAPVLRMPATGSGRFNAPSGGHKRKAAIRAARQRKFGRTRMRFGKVR